MDIPNLEMDIVQKQLQNRVIFVNSVRRFVIFRNVFSWNGIVVVNRIRVSIWIVHVVSQSCWNMNNDFLHSGIPEFADIWNLGKVYFFSGYRVYAIVEKSRPGIHAPGVHHVHRPILDRCLDVLVVIIEFNAFNHVVVDYLNFTEKTCEIVLGITVRDGLQFGWTFVVQFGYERIG